MEYRLGFALGLLQVMLDNHNTNGFLVRNFKFLKAQSITLPVSDIRKTRGNDGSEIIL